MCTKKLFLNLGEEKLCTSCVQKESLNYGKETNHCVFSNVQMLCTSCVQKLVLNLGEDTSRHQKKGGRCPVTFSLIAKDFYLK